MKTKIQNYIENLDDDEKIRIIYSYEKFEIDGCIGDEPVRVHARELMAELGTNDTVVMLMHQLVYECYRYFARRWIRQRV